MTEREKQFGELYQSGLALIKDGKDSDGMDLLYHAAKCAPEGWLALANNLIKEGMHTIAAERCSEILKLTKDVKICAAAYNNLGMIACMMGDTSSALAYFKKSIEKFPNAPDSYSNMGLLAQWRGDFKEAIRYASRALSIDHWHEQAAFIRSMCLLMDCDYERGFEEYECRWRSKTNNLSKITCNMPEWDGTNGKRVYVYGEQGCGDTILMLRYASEIKKLGIEQCWVGQKGLDSLMRTMPEIDLVCEVGGNLPEFDCHIPSVSLPRIFKTTIDSIPESPYIAMPDVKKLDGFNVAICWRGSTAQTNDAIRSTSLELWKPVIDLTGVNFHSIQVDGKDEGLLYPQLIQHPTPKDWLETARLVSQMDLVISVDTSIVHLCGALDVTCWCALHCRPYFVYPPRFKETSPWYKSVRLFRQEKEYQWQPVFERIANELKRITK
jgi:tetratricopeptide (TPR) repeat protein